MYPLANDENGHPIEVPAQAAGWLVRRHGGGKGRPAAVYDGEGRPLVVPLEAMAADLTAAGLAAGVYRLEAVDGGRRPLDAVAYTEIGIGAGMEAAGGGELKPSTPQDALLLAVARAMESMQRVQAERERHYAEILKRAIDRLGPGAGGGGFTWKDLDDYDRRKAKAIDEEIARRNSATPAVVEGVADGGDADDLSPLVEKLAIPVMNKVLSLADVWISSLWAKRAAKAPATLQKAAPAGAGGGAATRPASAAPAGSDGAAKPTAATPSVDSSTPMPEGAIEPTPEIAAKFEAVDALLTPEEHALVEEALPKIPDHLRGEFGRPVLLMRPEKAVEVLRAHVFPQLRRLLGKAE